MSINIQETNPELVYIFYKKTIDKMSIICFLQSRGYKVQEWLWRYQDTVFPGGTTSHEKWTFTATKNDEQQSEDTLYLSVFEKELRKSFPKFT